MTRDVVAISIRATRRLAKNIATILANDRKLLRQSENSRLASRRREWDKDYSVNQKKLGVQRARKVIRMNHGPGSICISECAGAALDLPHLRSEAKEGALEAKGKKK